MRVLGRIKAVETWERVADIVQNEDENTYVRIYAAEAIGAMQKPESEKILARLFEDDDPLLRAAAVRGIAYFNTDTSRSVIIQALRDSQYRVRYEAVDAVKKNNITEAVPYLVFRCKDKNEQGSVKDECYKVIAKLNTAEGNDYLISIVKDNKKGDSERAKVSAALLEQNNAGTNEIIELAQSTLQNDLHKNLRYALGKEFAKYSRPEFAGICASYIAHRDVATQGTGLDIWAKGRYQSCRAAVEEIAKDAANEEPAEDGISTVSSAGTATSRPKTKNANAEKAKRILEQSS